MGAPATRPAVLEWLHRNANIQVHVKDIAKDTGLSIEQVQGALGNLRRENGLNIETILRGQLVIFHSVPEKPEPIGKRVFEEIGVTKDGRIVIQDVDGKLYETREL